MSDSDSYCEDIVRRFDDDRYLATVFAPPATRPHLFALYAFNFEVAKTAETVSNGLVGQIRLQWWRDAIDGIYRGEVREHPVALALADVVYAHDLPRALFDDLINMHELDFEPEPFSDIPMMATYGDMTSGNLMRLALRVLGGGERFDAVAGTLGGIQAIVGLVRNFAFGASRGRQLLPVVAFAFQDAVREDVLVPPPKPGLDRVIGSVVERALDYLKVVPRVPRKFLPALLPVTLVRLYARSLTRPGYNPFYDSTDAPRHRRQLAMTRAMLRGRL